MGFCYTTHYDGTYFVTRFLGGLQEEIRSVIALHRPADVQTASAPALLQEEELNNLRGKGVQRDTAKISHRSVMQSDKFATPDRTMQNRNRPEMSDTEDKFKSLMAFRKKNGLFYKCGEKWGQMSSTGLPPCN